MPTTIAAPKESAPAAAGDFLAARRHRSCRVLCRQRQAGGAFLQDALSDSRAWLTADRKPACRDRASYVIRQNKTHVCSNDADSDRNIQSPIIFTNMATA